MGLTRMLPSEEKPLPAVGAYWIEEADYPALLKIFADGDTMPRAWKEWLKMAEEMEKGLKAYGHPVMRVRIDPATFPAWCAAHGTTPGRQGRKMFIAAAVLERYGDQT
jgi:hypothetical protein